MKIEPVLGTIIVVACSVFFALALAWILGGGSDGSRFERHCDRHDGVVAIYSHGKSHEYFCIVGNRVIDHE